MKELIIVVLGAWTLSSCNPTTEEKSDTTGASSPEIATEKNLLPGSWVEPNPINEKEVQGFVLHEDGTAESINMATLRYKEWWKEADTLVMVAESSGNGVSSIDTTKYAIVKLDAQALEIKDRAYSATYKKQ